MRKTLLALRHNNGEHVCTIYGVSTPEVSFMKLSGYIPGNYVHEILLQSNSNVFRYYLVKWVQ